MVPKLFETKATHGFCNSKGEIIVSARFNDVKSNEYFNAFEVGGYWGFLDETGKCICEAKYSSVQLEGEYAFVNVSPNGRLYGVIDKNMNKVLAPEFFSIESYNEEYYMVEGINENRNKYMLYSKDFKKCYTEVFFDKIVVNENYIALNIENTVIIKNIVTNRLIDTYKADYIYNSNRKIKGFKGEYPAFVLCDNKKQFIVLIKDDRAKVIYDDIMSYETIYSESTNGGKTYFSIFGTTLFAFDKIYYLNDSNKDLEMKNIFPFITKSDCYLKYKADEYLLISKNRKKWYLISGLGEKDIICARTKKMKKILKDKKLIKLYKFSNNF